MTADRPAPRKQPAMNPRPRNPFVPEYQRPERWDAAWQKRRDPIGFRAVEEVSRRGY